MTKNNTFALHTTVVVCTAKSSRCLQWPLWFWKCCKQIAIIADDARQWQSQTKFPQRSWRLLPLLENWCLTNFVHSIGPILMKTHMVFTAFTHFHPQNGKLTVCSCIAVDGIIRKWPVQQKRCKRDFQQVLTYNACKLQHKAALLAGLGRIRQPTCLHENYICDAGGSQTMMWQADEANRVN